MIQYDTTMLDDTTTEILTDLKEHLKRGKLTGFNVKKDIKDKFQHTANIDSIANVIKEIGDTIPLVRREDGSPDAYGTLQLIKATDKGLYNKLIIYSLLSRSTWGTSLTECAPLASFTPIVLVAYKSECSFAEWDTEANWDTPIAMFICLGTMLGNLMMARPETQEIFNPEFIKELSSSGIKYKIFKTADAEMPRSFGNAGMGFRRIGGKKATMGQLKSYAYMLSSTWIAHPSIRNPNTMILDIFDWDLVPESIEVEEALALDVEEVLNVKQAAFSGDDL